MGKRNADHDMQSESPHKRFKYEAVQLSPGSLNDFVLTKEIVDGTILTDLCQKDWRVGKPIGKFDFYHFACLEKCLIFLFLLTGKGSFGEIFLASDDIHKSVTTDNAKYVVKIEPHSNGPLFVEIHCLINIGKTTSRFFLIHSFCATNFPFLLSLTENLFLLFLFLMFR